MKKPKRNAKASDRGQGGAGPAGPPGPAGAPGQRKTRSINDLGEDELAQLRAMFEAGAKRDEMAQALNIPFGGIYWMAQKAGWIDPRTGYPYRQQVKDEDAKRRADELRKLSALGIPTDMSDVIPPSPDDHVGSGQFHDKRNARRAAVLIRHISEWDELDNIRRKALEGNDPKVMFDWAKLAKITHETLMIKQMGERLAHNIIKGDPVSQMIEGMGDGNRTAEVEVFLKTSLSLEDLQLLHSVSNRAKRSIAQGQAGQPVVRDVTPPKDKAA